MTNVYIVAGVLALLVILMFLAWKWLLAGKAIVDDEQLEDVAVHSEARFEGNFILGALRADADAATTIAECEAVLLRFLDQDIEDTPESAALVFDVFEKMRSLTTWFDEAYGLYRCLPRPGEDDFDLEWDKRFAERALELATTPNEAQRVFDLTPTGSAQERAAAECLLALVSDKEAFLELSRQDGFLPEFSDRLKTRLRELEGQDA